MEIADWDNGSVILHGLLGDMKPYRVRLAVESRLVIPSSENMIRRLFRQMVVFLYAHQKNTEEFRLRVSTTSLHQPYDCVELTMCRSPTGRTRSRTSCARYMSSRKIKVARSRDQSCALQFSCLLRTGRACITL